MRRWLIVALALCGLNARLALSQNESGVPVDSTTGRALIPMQRFRPAAERLGYIVISSYNTLSDGPIQPNYVAMNAMWADVQTSLSVDARRLYLVGFSGTTRFAWLISTHELVGSVAGIIGAGAAVPGSRSWIRSNIGKSAPVLYGTIGTLDANFEEVRQLDEELETFGTPWVDSLYSAWLARAVKTDSSGDAWTALRQYRQLRADFLGLADVSRVEARVTALTNDARAKRGQSLAMAASQRDLRAIGDLVSFSSEFIQSTSPPSLDEARKRLDLDKLRKDAARTDDTTAALAAATLRIARYIKPDDGVTCFSMARALAQAGDKPGALQALECAAASKQLTVAAIEGDTLLRPLRGEARYDAVVRQLKAP